MRCVTIVNETAWNESDPTLAHLTSSCLLVPTCVSAHVIAQDGTAPLFPRPFSSQPVMTLPRHPARDGMAHLRPDDALPHTRAHSSPEGRMGRHRAVPDRMHPAQRRAVNTCEGCDHGWAVHSSLRRHRLPSSRLQGLALLVGAVAANP